MKRAKVILTWGNGGQVPGEIVKVHRHGTFDVIYKIGDVRYCKRDTPRRLLS